MAAQLQRIPVRNAWSQILLSTAREFRSGANSVRPGDEPEQAAFCLEADSIGIVGIGRVGVRVQQAAEGVVAPNTWTSATR